MFLKVDIDGRIITGTQLVSEVIQQSAQPLMNGNYIEVGVISPSGLLGVLLGEKG